MTSSLAIALAIVALGLASCNAQIYTGGASSTITSSINNVDSSSSSSTNTAEQQQQQQPVSPEFTTQTVYGFLDFTTTIANTVMVFSPQSAPPEGSSEPKPKEKTPIETKPTSEKKKAEIQPSKTHKVDESSSKDNKIIVNSVVEQNVVSQSDELTQEKTTEAVTNNPTVEQTSSEAAELRPNDDVPGVKNNLAEPEYDFLSRQPAEVVDENYKVINLKPSNGKSGLAKPRASPVRPNKENPTGLVTKLGGTIVKDGLTTVHETSVIGTYINGKYAQVLQSSSHVLNEPDQQQQQQQQPSNVEANRIRPSGTQRILKTIGPQGKLKLQQQQQQQLEPTSPSQNDEFHEFGAGGNRAGRQRATGQLRPKFRNKIVDEANNAENNAEPAQQQQQRPSGKNKPNGTARPGYKNRASTTQSTPTTAEPVPRRRNSNNNGGGFRPSNSAGNPTKQYKNSKNENSSPLSTSNPLVKSKLPRTQGRWSYKSTPKPRIQIRKQAGSNAANPTNNAPNLGDDQQLPPGVSTEQSVVVASQPELESGLGGQRREAVDFDAELEEGESEDPPNVSVPNQGQGVGEGEGQLQQPTPTRLPVETLNVEISTPADVNDIYFEIATIKSPYEFQVGSTRNTRFVTVTSTIKKSFATAEPQSPNAVSPTEPLTENILANTGAAYESSLPLDSSIATLPAITLEPSQATPPLETITETFSTTQTLLKTHLLPVVVAGGNSTSRITLVQTYNVARIVTATKTLPPPEIYQFIPSKTLNEFNSKLDEAGSELHLELDFGDDESDDDDVPKRIVAPSSDLDSDLEPLKGLSPTKRHKGAQPSATPSGGVPVPAEPSMSSEQMQQLALLKLLGQTPQVITTSKPVIKLETVWDTHVIPLVNAGNTIFSTLSRPIATVTRTSYELGTSTIAPVLPPQPLLPQVPAAPLPLFPPAAPQFTVTSQPLVQQTIATVSDSRVLKLTFGAKTAYTTLYSTRLVPTEITTFVTSTLALQPTVAAYPGFFPPAAVGYPGYPYVG